jgi:hypothetical protein
LYARICWFCSLVQQALEQTLKQAGQLFEPCERFDGEFHDKETTKDYANRAMVFQEQGIANTMALLLSVRQTTKDDAPLLLVPLVKEKADANPFVVVLTGKALRHDCFDAFIGEVCSYFHSFCPNVTAFFRAESETLEFMPTLSARGRQSKSEDILKLANTQYNTERSRMK